MQLQCRGVKMRRRAVLVCLAAGGRTLGACRGNIRIVYCEWCKYVVMVWENLVGG